MSGPDFQLTGTLTLTTSKGNIVMDTVVGHDHLASTPRTWLFAELKNRGHSEKILRILQEE